MIFSSTAFRFLLARYQEKISCMYCMYYSFIYSDPYAYKVQGVVLCTLILSGVLKVPLAYMRVQHRFNSSLAFLDILWGYRIKCIKCNSKLIVLCNNIYIVLVYSSAGITQGGDITNTTHSLVL